MVDSSKRKTLLSLSGVMAIPFVPLMASANTRASDQFNSKLCVDPADQFVSVTDGELDITLVFDGAPMMKVTNTTDTLTILRRIHPGIVHVGNKSFDLNQSLLSSAYAIGAGKSRYIPLIQATQTAAEPVLAARYHQRRLRVASISSQNNKKRVSSTSKAFFV